MGHSASTSANAIEADLGRGAQARLALVRAGMEVFGENSLESATTRQIAQRASQNIAAIAYYFGGKEGLYLAVAEHIVEIILRQIGPLLDEIAAFLRQAARPSDRCLDYLKQLLAASVGTSQPMLPVTRIIVREQTQPTKAFDILYRGSLERWQRTGAHLLAAYIGGDPDSPEFVVRFHALLGEALAFRVARETIIRRAGWTQIGEKEEALIKACVAEHAELILRGLRTRYRGGADRIHAQRRAGERARPKTHK